METLKGKIVSWVACGAKYKGKVTIDYGGYVQVKDLDSSARLWIPKSDITIETP